MVDDTLGLFYSSRSWGELELAEEAVLSFLRTEGTAVLMRGLPDQSDKMFLPCRISIQ